MNNKSFPIIEFKNISKQFNNKAILSKINLSIYRGEIIGITGPIGAGKTTLTQTALGLVTPDAGNITIFNLPLNKHRQSILQRINYASSSLRLNGYSTIMENLLVFAGLYKIANPKLQICSLARIFHIQHLIQSQQKVYKLSSGENSTINLCKALLNDPDILFLDEITSHMDSGSARRALVHLQSRTDHSKSVVMISQNIPELCLMCNRIVFMKNGKIIRIFNKRSFKQIYELYD